ncbi:MAG: hypothetical protein ACYC4S_18100 [Rhodoferax sp.]
MSCLLADLFCLMTSLAGVLLVLPALSETFALIAPVPAFSGWLCAASLAREFTGLRAGKPIN